MLKNLKECTLTELEHFFLEIGEKKFRAKQVWQWMYRGVTDFEEMTDLSKSLRENLKQRAMIEAAVPIKIQHSQLDGTRKYLFRFADGNAVESVFMAYRFGNSVCISSQAGCRMGCHFCASTLAGLKRNLTAGEMVDQIIGVEKETGDKVSHVVVMGTGEPFDNYDNLCKFIHLSHQKDGLNLGLRNITVSTCGLIPQMKRFAKDFPQVNLAISLHAPNDGIRNKIMPINQQYNIEEILQACKEHTQQTGRRITFEYALLKDLNDQEQHAKQLAAKLKGLLCHVNLIPLNPVSESKYSGTNRRQTERFCDILEKMGLSVTIRRKLGSDIDAACGQLRLNQLCSEEKIVMANE